MPNPSLHVEMSKAISSAKYDRNILTAAKGGSIVFSGSIFKYGSRFVIGIVLARFLGAEQYGLYSLGLTAVELAAGLASLGLGTALVRYISMFASRRDIARLWGALQVGLALPTVLSVFFGIGLYALANPIAEQLFHAPELAPLLRLVSLVVPLYTLSDMAAAATRGFKNMHYTVIAQNVFQPTSRLILILGIAVIWEINVARVVTVSALAEIMVCCLLVYFLNKQFALKRPWRMDWRGMREMLGFSLPNYVSYLVRVFGGNIKTLLLGTLYGVTSVGVFTLAAQVNMISDLFHSSIVTVSQPIIAEIHSQGDREPLSRFYQTATRWSFSLNFPLFLTIVLFPGPIMSLFGRSFADGEVILSILAWAGLVGVSTGLCGVMIEMTGNTQWKMVNSIMASVLNIGFSALLVPSWGLIGAAVSSLAAVIAINLLRLLEVFILLRMLPYNMNFLKPIVAGLLGAAASWGISRLLPFETGLVYLVVNVVTVFVVYVGMIFLLGLSQEDYMILARLRKRVGGQQY